MSVVIVLTPNGRRQNVKITPNTTLLQVLEEVCSKHGLKPEKYGLRHHNKILDLSSIFRFSGLPNNAQLEMIEVTKQRLESPVMLGLHLESGDRLTGEFTPSDNLWNVIVTLNPEKAKSFKNPVVIYMMKEVSGQESLEKTTLRSLGLTGGRAILRFFNKSPEELHTQANVSAVLTHSNISTVEKEKFKAPEPQVKENQTVQTISSKVLLEIDSLTAPNTSKEDSVKSVRKGNSQNKEPDAPKILSTRGKETEHEKNKVNNKNMMSAEEKKVILLGERNAVAYNLNKIKPVVFEEVPDDFYDLTISDAKLLLSQAKKLCAELEEAPLMTSAQRELEKNKKILSLLNQYKKTVLRIKFPDRTVLQGTFSSVEKISAVEKFVAGYLENPKISFYLYTSPPKEILKSNSNLLECNCVPCAVLYFGVDKSESKLDQFLRSDVLKKFSSPSAAALAAFQSRGLTLNKNIENDEVEISDVVINNDSSFVANPSTSMSTSPSQTTSRGEQEKSPPFKVPKWFKMNK